MRKGRRIEGKRCSAREGEREEGEREREGVRKMSKREGATVITSWRSEAQRGERSTAVKRWLRRRKTALMLLSSQRTGLKSAITALAIRSATVTASGYVTCLERRGTGGGGRGEEKESGG